MLLQLVLSVVLGLSMVFGQQMTGQGPPGPPFLVGASTATVQDFHSLLMNSAQKGDQHIERSVEMWVRKQSKSIQTKFEVFKKEMERQKSMAEVAHHNAIALFSPEARAADAKLTAIAKNPNMSAGEKSKQIEVTMQSLPEKVRSEIEKAMQMG